MNRNFFRTCTLIGAVGVLGVLASCGENAVGPTGKMAPVGPSFNASVPFNNNGVCMGDDAVAAPDNTVPGVKNGSDPLTAANCTSQDVKVATTNLISYRLGDENGNFSGSPILYTGQEVSCTKNQAVELTLTAELDETSTSTRHDIGVWIATDGGEAISGQCNHYNLVEGGTVTDEDGDSCGDLTDAANVTGFQLGTITTVCQVDPTPLPGSDATQLHIGSCLGWTEPGADRTCPVASTADGAGGFRWGTLHGNQAKCNCDGFNVDITVLESAFLEVQKVCEPTTDAGLFNLQIDATTEAADAACGGTTGKKTVGAGDTDSDPPGASHSFGETAGTGTSLSDYTSTRECHNRGETAGNRLSSAAGTGGTLTLLPDDDVVCTITNTRKGTVVIIKDAQPNDAKDFSFTSSIAGNTAFDLDDDGDNANTLSNTKTISGLNPGTYTVTEASSTGWDLTNISCVDATTNSSGVIATGVATINLGAGETVTCTYTNVKQGSIVIVKDAVPDDAQNFAFTSTIAGNASFNLDDDADNTLSNTNTINNVTPGTYTVTEAAVTGWDLTNITCVDPTTNSSGVIGTGVATINLAAGESVTCTYTNTKRPKLTVVKRVKNDHGGTKAVGDFSVGTNAGSLTFDAGSADGTNITKYTSNTLTVVPGTYSLTESNVTGYDEGTWSCTGVAGTVTPTFSAGSVQLAAGEVAVCTITNDDQPATLKIIKTVKGDGGSFPFTTSGSGLSGFTLSPASNGSDNKEFTGLSAGTYSVTETDPAPFLLTDLGCDNQAPGTYDPAVTKTVSITLTNGQTVTCTFINEKRTSGGTTRTQGFWATHSSITNKAWFGGSIGGNTFSGVADKTLCAAPTKDLNTLGRVLGGFWSNIAQKSTGQKRTAIDQARMQLVQQLLAAILNNSVFGSSPSGPISIQQAEDAYCGSDINAIKAATSAMGAFNESGDSGVFTPGVSANGKLAKSLADLAYWNTLP